MSPKAKKRTLVFFSATGLVLAAGWIALHPRHHDPYPFLQSHDLVDVGVRGPGSFGPAEIRLYSWQQPYREVIAQAKAELPKFGLKLRKFKNDTSDSANWTGDLIDGGPCGVGSDLWITISPGHQTSLASMMKTTDKSQDWTTVTISSSLDESWFNVVRYSLFAMHY